MIAWGTQLFVPLAGGAIAAFSLVDGRAAWTSRLDGVAGSLHLAADTRAVYVTSSDGHAAALLQANGGTVWHRTLEGALTPPALARDRVIVGSSNDHFYALDPRNGDQKWRWDEPADPVGAVADLDVVFLTGLENTVRAVARRDGNQKWRAVLGTRPTNPPHAFGLIVVVVGDSPTLSVFIAKTGVAAGTYTAPAKLIGAPLIDPTLRAFSPAVFVIMREGNVVGLTPTAMQLLEVPPVPLIPLPGRQLTREPPPAAPPPR
jgi:outer membrane protein assembly factor BamB